MWLSKISAWWKRRKHIAQWLYWDEETEEKLKLTGKSSRLKGTIPLKTSRNMPRCALDLWLTMDLHVHRVKLWAWNNYDGIIIEYSRANGTGKYLILVKSGRPCWLPEASMQIFEGYFLVEGPKKPWNEWRLL